MPKPSIVFFGTGEVSLKTIEGIADHFEIEAIITKPDLTTSSGKTRPAELKIWAEEHQVPCFTPSNKAELGELIAAQKFKSEVGLVVDYGIIIPQDVIDSFSKGILNSHFSLLPKLRGADPITFAVLEGHKETGVSIMQLVAKLDEGDIIAQEKYQMPASTTTPQLTTDLIELSNKMLATAIPEYLEGRLKPQLQVGEPTYSRKLSKEDGLLDPTKTAIQLECQIRAFIDWPKSYMFMDDLRIVITKANVSGQKSPAGKLSVIDKKLYFGCKDGSLEILEIQPVGKAKMDARSFINGYYKFVH
jgi:methionyl-tRNA formyltransferase